MSDAEKKGSNLKLRVWSALVLAPIVLAAVYFGGWALSVLLAVAGGIIAWEWTRLTVQDAGWRDMLLPSAAGVFVPLLATWEWQTAGELPLTLLTLGGATLFAAIGRIAFGDAKNWASAAGGVLYACLPVLTVLSIRAHGQDYGEGDGIWLLVLILFIVWAMDIGAYFSGKTIGGPKMAPRLSPNKTWAGLIGGMITAGVVAAVFGGLFDLGVWWHLLLIGALLGAWSQVGDVVESSLKRQADVKDASNIIPGHGGVMDRVDGLWFAVPFFWLFLQWGLIGSAPAY
ncbi:MAG: phosphatidate cytidylyltransferase [Alphaproteobacteria bacterium]